VIRIFDVRGRELEQQAHPLPVDVIVLAPESMLVEAENVVDRSWL
jgi:hypothetical protein